MDRKICRLAALTTILCGTLAGSQLDAQTAGVRVEVLSSLPQFVTGGDALVKISGASAAPNVTVGGADASAAFKSDGKGGWVGLVTGLKDGNNPLVAKAGGSEGSLTLVNHPINGTLFAGPQQKPFVCENETHGLAAAKDETCAAPTQVSYFYRSATDKKWKAYNANGPKPADLDSTTTNAGAKVPLIVRFELGVINRAAYVISLLHDPADPAPTPTARSAGWNGKVIYASRGGVGAGYHQGPTIGSLDVSGGAFVAGENNNLHQSLIEAGYALVASSLNVTGTTDNDVIQAETTAKVKERFIELFGQPVFMIGMGTSGGSMSQHLVANNYPGLYDGIMPWRSYPDVMSFWQPLYDCQMLNKYFGGTKTPWTDTQKTAVSGKITWGYCLSNDHREEGNIDPADCNAVVKAALAFDPKMIKPRCTYADNSINVFGIDPATGFARIPWDNVGVQYGLKALNDGIITFDQFVELNTRIGGHDLNGKNVANRSHGDPEALRIAYATGRMSTAGAGLASIPILDVRGYTDGICTVAKCPPRDPTNVDVHDGYHSLTTRARLMKANGNANNQVRLVSTEVGHRNADSVLSIISVRALAQFDKWVSDVVADTSNRPKAEKVAAHRPKDLVDACFTGVDAKVTNMDVCQELFPLPSTGDARLAAGAPRTDDILKCQLKPVSASDYKTAPAAAQIAQLQQAFPEGVCDYTKPGVGQVALTGTWGIYKGDGKVEFLAPAR